MYAPEYLKTGMIFLLREGRTKILGTISKLIDDNEIGKDKVKFGKKELQQIN